MKTNMVSQKIREYINDCKRNKIWKSATFVMSIMTVFCITFVLIRPAMTMENNQLTDITEAETETYVSEEALLEESSSEEEFSEEEMLNQDNQIMLMSAFLNGEYNGISWQLSPAMDGGYSLILNAVTSTAVPSDLFGSNSELSEYKNSISAVSFDKGITAVADNAFSGSEQLRTVEFAEESQLTEIGSGAFSDCKQLSKVNLEACTVLATLGENSFNGTNLVQVTIPGSVATIGNFAFYGCANLNSVYFQPNTSLENMGAFVFANCTSLEEINLQNLTGENLTFGTNGSINFDGMTNANGMFYNCTALKSLTLPNMSGSIASICRNCKNLTEINFDNCHKLQYDDTTGNANFKDFLLGSMGVHELNLSGVTGMTTLFPSTVGGGVKKVTLPPYLTKINSVVISSTGVEEVIFTKDQNGKSHLERLESSAFKNATNLKEINLQFTDEGSPYLNGWVFNNCQKLEKITISSSVNLTMDGEKHFTSCPNLNELIWNVKSVNNNITSTLVDDKTSRNIHFTVGEKVEKLPSGLIENLKDNISEYSFAPDHSFYIDSAVEGTPFKMAGCYYADTKGNLYLLNDPLSAELVYASHSGNGNFEIPAELNGVTYYNADGSIDTDKTTFIIEKVCSDAFKNTAYTSITFTAPANITDFENRAFAGAYNLGKINDKSTEQDIKALFSDTNFGNDVFAETSITSNPFSGIESGTRVPFIKDNGDETFSYPSFSIGDRNLVQISVESESALPELKEKCVLATGEPADLKIGVSNKNDGKQTRVYIKLSDADSGIIVPPEGETLISLGNGIYYYDVPVVTGQTNTKHINITYPNGASPDKKAYIWLAETNNETINFGNDQIIYPNDTTVDGFTASDKYLEVTWDVLPETYSVKKTTNNITPAIKTKDNVHTVENLSFNVSNNMTKRLDNIGADYVNYITYVDTLTLPSGISWKNELFDVNTKIKPEINGNKHSGIITADIGGVTYTLCTLNLDSEILRELRYELTDDGKNFKIIWSTENQIKNTQISDAETIITYGSGVLTATSSEENYTITNHVDATPYYIYSGEKEPKSAYVSRDVSKGTSDLKITKEWFKQPEYMGEKAVYKISVVNNSLTEHTGVVEIYDDFNKCQYLTPETIEEMFTNPDYDSKYLTIEIKNAVLMPTDNVVNPVKAADGKTSDITTSVNNTAKHNLYSGLVKKENYNPEGRRTVNITIKKSGDNIIISSTGNDDIKVNDSSSYKTIQDALDYLGYIVTADDNYVAHWDFPASTVLEAKYNKNYIINATVKNSLQALQNDMNISIASKSTSYNYPVKNTLYTSKSNYDKKTGGQAVQCNPGCDLSIDKTALVGNTPKNSEQLADTIKNDETVICYKLNLNHNGTGKYGLLPVVDKMSGVQAVLALKEDNKNAPWADHCGSYPGEDGKYYVLNQNYTYEGVYLENAYADSITVKPTEKGLETLIKWYYIDDTGSEYNIVPTYNVIFSQDYAGNNNTKASYSINNEVWINDLPTHRIYDSIGAEGTSVTFNKKIVTYKSDTPGEKDTLWESDLPYPIASGGEKITYRLEFNNNGGKLSLKGNEFYDELPETVGFNWTENDVTISYEVTDAGITVTHDGTNLLGASESDGNEFSVSENKIRWNDNFIINFPAVNSSAYIYVTLEFPKNQTWLDYVAAKKTDILHNTLYLHDIPSQVSHTLPVEGKAMLRKGVYETGYYVVDANGSDNRQYFRGTNRFNYIKTPGDAKTVKNTVTYFVVLYNGGDTNLYLSSIYDQLPEGFTFHTLVSTTTRGERDGNIPSSGCVQLYQGTPDIVGLTYNVYDRLALPDAKHNLITWKWTGSDWYRKEIVDYTVKKSDSENINGRQMLKFDITIDNTHKDDRGYFLKPNEAIQFGYMCYTGNADIQKAVNSCAMEYIDYSLAGVKPPDNTDIKVSTYNGIHNDNNGDAKIWSNEEAKTNGFTTENDFITLNENNLAGQINGDRFREWLASSVELEEGEIKPGITKSVENYYVKKDSPAIWTVKSENSGTNAMTDYTIEDIMQSPLVFTGEVKYNIYSQKNNTEHYLCRDGNNKDKLNCSYVAGAGTKDNDYLFKILSMNENEIKVTSNMNNNQISFTYDTPQDITVSVKRENNTTSDVQINVCFTKKDGNASMTINFKDYAWSIPANGYSELTLQTAIPKDYKSPDGKPLDGIYNNKAIITPEQEWHPDDSTKGEISTNGNKKSLTNVAPVSIYSNVATASYKEISAEGKYGVSANYKDKGDKLDFITIDEKTSEITYTLNVSSPDCDMAELVLIDTLPQTGDTSPVNDAISRNSEFKVNFAGDPKVNVCFVKEDGTQTSDEINYTVQYSSKKSGFDDNDWKGLNADKWHNELNPAEHRSIRVHITTNLPTNTRAQVSFKAVIDTSATDSDKAEAGEYAWNSFGYNFKEKVGSNMWLHAAPLNVGLEIPSVPGIEKKLVKSHDRKSPAEAEEDRTFSFVIYKGKGISFTKYDKETIESKLNGKNFFTVDALVSQGSSTSGRIELKPADDKKWFWEHGKEYTIVEIDDSTPPDSEKDNYIFGYIKDEHSSDRSYTFKYDTTQNQLFTVANVKQEKEYELPATGGSGTYLFTIGGLLLIAGSLYGIRQKRKNYMNN